MSRKREKASVARAFRCAIYTRKSTEEGLEQEFNSLDAQRDAGEAYVKSQLHEGWECLAQRYDDGGFTGANMDRPALRRLLADIEAGHVDCVVVYKVDRLSRSLLDFARIMETFERHKVSFVSVTQAFNTASSMGRLVLNVLLSFAQFEREMIAERTRDKIAAARRKGKWSGGMPVLGYTVVQTKLVVDESEADRVRQIFAMYLERQSLLEVVKELNARNWRTKGWTTRRGNQRGGRPFDKTTLYKLLTNVAYVGQVRYKQETHAGEHAAIVDADVFQKVQALLRRNYRSGGRSLGNPHRALLRGILRCRSCECGMNHTYTSRGSRQYRYYVCRRAQKQGWHTCPSPSLPAGDIERCVVDQIRCVGRDATLIGEVLAQASRHSDEQAERLTGELKRLRAQLRAEHSELGRLASAPDSVELIDAQNRVAGAERRASQIESELAESEGLGVDESDVAAALSDFDAVWDCLAAAERRRLVELLVERVMYDDVAGTVAVTFRASGIRLLAIEASDRKGDEA
ncbi:MAG: recombinase family protein [Pirellulales bacterium]